MSDSEIKNVGEILDLTKQLEAIEKERSTVLNKLAKAVGKGVKVKKPATRRRGRPAKAKPVVKRAAKAKAVKKAAPKPAAKRGRGRPRKAVAAAAKPAAAKKAAPAKAAKPRGRKPGRGPRPGSAVAYAVQVLEDAGRPLTINELVEGINKKGFTSKAKNPATSVAQQLYKSPYVKAKAGKFSLP